MATKYYVEQNNWSSNIQNALASTRNGELNVTVGNGGTDPAPGCALKTFSAIYKCGASDVEKTIEKENAAGKNVRFDCKDSYDKCNGLKLTLGDDGVLILSDSANPELWKSETPKWGEKPLKTEQYVATKGKYGVPYLVPGQFLEVGEFMGSPSGTCYLMMAENKDEDGKVVSRALQVMYNVLGCDDDTKTPIAPIDKNSSKLYNLDWKNRGLVGKMGYVNEFGQLKEYSEENANLFTYGNAYEKIGDEMGFYGGDIEDNITAANAAECEKKCSASTTTPCVGFVYDTSGNRCELKKDTIYSAGNRFIHPTSSFYMRTRELNKNLLDNSCPADALTGSIDDWTSFSTANGNLLNGVVDTSKQKCGLGKYTEKERAQKIQADSRLDTFKEQILSNLTKMKSEYKSLKRKLLGGKIQFSKVASGLQQSRKAAGDWTGKQLKQLESMDEDRHLNMRSQNFKYVLWTILAILLILATFLLMKKNTVA